MSNKVDTRVVRMEFDNAQFEKKVKQTTKSLDKLNQSMDFHDAGSGLDDLKVKISAVEVAAIAAISRVTNRVIDLGIQLVKSLSVDNIAAGWAKYGDKTTSVATMIAQKIRIAGKEIDDQAEKLKVVNEQLELLNWFSDETSYSFNDMVSNVGKFTAAGQDLDTSVKAMEGIATWAALSGQNAQTASIAMYQLAQAMSAGSVKLQDWKSIQNANMDTEEFRQKILETAVALGELTKEGDEYITKTGKRFKQAQFTTMLSEGWFTSDVLIKGLEKYSAAVSQIYEIAERTGKTASEVIEEYGDQLDEFGIKAFKAAQEARTFTDVLNSIKDAVSSKWMQTFENIFGGQDESVKLWTELANELYDVFAESGNFRNNILSIWGELGGRNDIFGKHGDPNQGAFWNMYDAIVAVIKTIKSAWNTIFPLSEMEDENDQAEDISRNLKNITKNIQQFTLRLKNNTKFLDIISRVSKLLFNTLKFGLNILRLVRFAIDPIIELAKQLTSRVLDEVLYYLEKINVDGSMLENFFVKIHDVLEDLLSDIDLEGLLEILFGILGKVLKLISKMPAILSKLAPLVKTIAKGIYEVVKWLLKIPGILNDAVKNLTGRDIVENISWILDKIISLFEKFTKKELKVSDKAQKAAIKRRAPNSESSSFENSGVLSPIMVFINGLYTFLKGAWKIIETIFVVVGNILGWIGDKLIIIGDKVQATFNKLYVLKDVAEKGKEQADGTWKKVAFILIVIVGIIGLVAWAISALAYSITGLISPFTHLADAVEELAYSKQLEATALMIKEIGSSILKIAVSIFLISKINWTDTAKSVILMVAGVGLVVAAIVAFVVMAKRLNKSASMLTKEINKGVDFIDTCKNAIVGISTSIQDAIESFKTSNILTSIAYLVSVVGNLMLKIAIAARIFQGVKWDAVWMMITIITIMFTEVTLMSKLAGDKQVDFKKATPGLLQLIAIATLVKTVGKTIASLSAIDPAKLLVPMLAVTEVFAFLLLLVYEVNRTSESIVKDGISRQTTSKTEDVFKGIAAMLLSMSLVLISVSFTVRTLSKIDPNKIGVSILAISAIFVLFFGLIRYIDKVNNASPEKGREIIEALRTFAKALASFALSMLILSLLSWEGVFKAITSIIGVLFSVSLLLSVIEDAEKAKDGDVEKTMKIFTKFATALAIFAVPMLILSRFSWESIAKAIVSIAGVLLAVFGIIGLASKVPGLEPSSMLIYGAALTVLAGSLMAFAGVMKFLEQLKFEKVSSGLLAIAAGLGTLYLAAFIGSKLILAILAVGAGLTIMGIAIILVATGIKMLREQVMAISGDSTVFFTTLAEGLEILLPALFKGIGEGMGTFLAGLLKGIEQVLPNIFSLIKTAIYTIYNFIVNFVPEIIDPVTELLDNILKALADHAESIADSVWRILLAVLKTFDDHGDEIFDKALNILIDLIRQLKLHARELVEELGGLLINLLESFGEWLNLNLTKIVKILLDIAAIILKSLAVNIVRVAALAAKIILTLIAFALAITISLLGSLMSLFVQLIGGILGIIINVISGFGKVLAQFLFTFILSVIDLLVTIISNSGTVLVKAFKSLFLSLGALLLGAFAEVIKDVPFLNVLYDPIMKAKDFLEKQAHDTVDVDGEMKKLKKEISNASSSILDTVSVTVNGIGDTLSSAMTIINDAADTANSALTEAFNDFAESGEDTGNNFIAGLFDAIDNGADDVAGATENVIDESIQAAKDAADINSPSRVMMQIGEYLVEGLSIGIQNGKDSVMNNLSNMLDSTIGLAKDIISDTEDNDITLVIGLDTSNVESQAAKVQDIMTGISNPTLSAYGENANYNAKASKKGSGSEEITAGSGIDKSTTVTYNNTFNISSTDPQESAEEIDKKLKEQGLRARYAKGMI